jgi:ABC-type lipoprotein release transport system permease subunit
MRRLDVFKLIMYEVALLGAVAMAVGAALAGALEAFGRLHGWPIEWFGGDMSGTAVSGVVYDPIYYSALTPEHAAVVAVGVYALFLASGLLPAAKAARLAPVEAVRQK